MRYSFTNYIQACRNYFWSGGEGGGGGGAGVFTTFDQWGTGSLIYFCF